jgi:hypothetical protein
MRQISRRKKNISTCHNLKTLSDKFYLNRKLVATRLVFSETVRMNALLFAASNHCICFHFAKTMVIYQQVPEC